MEDNEMCILLCSKTHIFEAKIAVSSRSSMLLISVTPWQTCHSLPSTATSISRYITTHAMRQSAFDGFYSMPETWRKKKSLSNICWCFQQITFIATALLVRTIHANQLRSVYRKRLFQPSIHVRYVVMNLRMAHYWTKGEVLMRKCVTINWNGAREMSHIIQGDAPLRKRLLGD